MIIGLTGPIGSGKTEAAKILRRRGAYIISADKIARKLYEPQTPVWSEIVKAFGVAVLQSGGKISRKKLAEVVFSDPKKLKILNDIMHPCMRKKIEEEIKDHEMRDARRGIIIIDAAIPQLFKRLADEVWVVLSSKEKRIKRLLKTGMDKKRILKIMKVQPAQKEYLKIADKVIENDRSIKQLRDKIEDEMK